MVGTARLAVGGDLVTDGDLRAFRRREVGNQVAVRLELGLDATKAEVARHAQGTRVLDLRELADVDTLRRVDGHRPVGVVEDVQTRVKRFHEFVDLTGQGGPALKGGLFRSRFEAKVQLRVRVLLLHMIGIDEHVARLHKVVDHLIESDRLVLRALPTTKDRCASVRAYEPCQIGPSTVTERVH